MAQVHRFRNRIAVFLPGEGGRGTTVYLTAEEARKLEAAIHDCRLDVRRRPSFAASEFSTVEFELEDPFLKKPQRSQVIQIRIRGEAAALAAFDVLHGYSVFMKKGNGGGWYTLRFRWTGPVKGLPGSALEYLYSCNIHPLSIRHVAP